MKTNKIRRYITSKLNTLGHEVYYNQASNEAIFPYIVYDLKANANASSTMYEFEVNIWTDKNRFEIEDIADLIELEFDDSINLDANGLLVFRWLSRGNVDDPNKELKRIMIKFEMEYFK